MVNMVPLERIVPNPYRNIESYPISEARIEALVGSFERSGFWDGSIQGRPGENGDVEIAFGHHRVKAAKRMGIEELGIVVADRSEEDMLRMMADENFSEFGHDDLANAEVVGAVIEAYGAGRIELGAVDSKDRSGGFATAGAVTKSYTSTTVARFLGWGSERKDGRYEPSKPFRRAFDLWHQGRENEAVTDTVREMRERGDASAKSVTEVTRAAREVTRSGTRLNPSQRKAAMAKAMDGVKSGKAGSVAAKSAVTEVKRGKPQDRSVDAHMHLEAAIREWQREIDPFGRLLRKVRELEPFVEDMKIEKRRELADAMEGTLNSAVELVDRYIKVWREGRPSRIKTLLAKDIER